MTRSHRSVIIPRTASGRGEGDGMSDLLGTLGSVIGVLDGLNARQSCLVTVTNETAETLVLVSHEAAHGDFATLPARTIPPGQSDTFGSADRQVAVLTGT